jgi:glutaminyl-peptide cyclotransferase
MKSISIVFAALALFAACKKAPVEETVYPVASYYRQPSGTPAFSGDRAFELLKAQVAYGPRVPNSAAHDACANYLRTTLAGFADTLAEQTFTFPGYDGASLRLTNFIAKFNPRMKDRILLCAHWDSRPWADKEEDATLHTTPIPGANDGASGVGVLLHLAELLHARRPDFGIDIVLFDGEDYGKESDLSMFCIGSKYFAASIDADYKPIFGVLLDLVGDSDAVFAMEGASRRYAGDVVELVWTIASRLYFKRFEATAAGEMYDDHIPLNMEAGIKTIDIIDADLVGHAAKQERRKYWHTLRDVPEQCSPKTLGEVGTVLTNLVYGLHAVTSAVASK